ncbi:MAG TPA: transcription elongation factor [Myxococcales bacterium]|nr:transcription elongation factor [Myxococcales bacterium]
MPEKQAMERAKKDLRRGKRPSTAAGEFVREEIEHVRGGKHGARSTQQAIAIGLSKARRAGVPLAPPPKGRAKASTRHQAEKDLAAGRGRATSRKRSRAVTGALRREPSRAASKQALSAHAKRTSAKRKRTSRRGR